MGIREAVSDADLVAQAARGDATAFDVLAGRYRGLMHAVCRRITRDDQDAVDALQEALLSAWTRAGQFEGRSAVRTWLFRIAANAATDQVRGHAQWQLADAAPVEERACGVDVEGAAVARTTLDWAFSRLPPQFRAAVVLREYYGMSYREIAEVLEVPVDTVKSRISRGRHALAELITPGFQAGPRP